MRTSYHMRRRLRDLSKPGTPLKPFLDMALVHEEIQSWKKEVLLRREDEVLESLENDSPLFRRAAASLLLASEDPSLRGRLWNLFQDSDRECRSLIIRRFSSPERQLLFNSLYEAYLRDPIPSIRLSARGRLRTEFSDLFTVNPANLSSEEKIHCLELLDKDAVHDHNLALRMMEDERPGIVLAAALFLERTGTLDRLIQEARTSNREDYRHRLTLLRRASDHQVASFLAKRKNLKSYGSLTLALELFNSGAESPLFHDVISRLLYTPAVNAEFRLLRRKALDCLLLRRDPASISLQCRLLRRRNWELFPILLEGLPAEGMQRFYPRLKLFLEDPAFRAWDALDKAYSRVTVSTCLSDLNGLVRDETRPFLVRKRALSLLIRLGESGTILYLLEHLDLARPVEGLNLAAQAAEEQTAFFDGCIRSIYASPDALLHRRMTAFLARSGNRRFIPHFMEQLKSPDPSCRSAALKALGMMGGEEEIARLHDFLRDPSDSVRISAAEVLLDSGDRRIPDAVTDLLDDPLEGSDVKGALLNALGASEHSGSLSLLLKLDFTGDAELQEGLLRNLALKSGSGDMGMLIRAFIDADSSRRELLETLFLRMGEAAESRLMELVESSSDPVLTAAVGRVLEQSGYVAALAAGLRSPFARVRKDAALRLSMIGTGGACRALLPAARDVNREIRLLTMKALVRLEGSSPFLEELASDPDARVRRYARWAKRRISARS